MVFQPLLIQNSQPCHRDLKSLHLVVIAFVVIASKMPWLLVKLVILRRLGGKEDSNKNVAFTIFDFRFSEQNGVFVWRYLSWWFWNPANHLRLVIYPTIYDGFHWCSWISETSTAKFQFFSRSCAKSFVISKVISWDIFKNQKLLLGPAFDQVLTWKLMVGKLRRYVRFREGSLWVVAVFFSKSNILTKR